jgi:putative ABC transport system permease protein
LKARAAIAFALRESRGARGRLMFFAACLALGVAAIVGVAALIGAIGDGIRSRSRELLGADVSVQARREPADPARRAHRGAHRDGRDAPHGCARVTTMARNPRNGSSQLVELTGVGAGYPLYGADAARAAGRSRRPGRRAARRWGRSS